MSKLTTKKELFAQKVVELDNQSEAYRIAYPHSQKWKDTAVWSCASTLASQPMVAQRIKEIRAELSKKEIITKEEMIRTYAEMYKVNPLDYMTVKNDDGEQKVIIKNLESLTEAQQKCIKSIKQTRNGVELELYSKAEIGDRIAKMLGFNEVERTSIEVSSKLTDEELMDQINKLEKNVKK